jgi:Cu2+-containing amine oxidase
VRAGRATLYAAGDTPNQHPGEPGLPQYVADDERIVGRDLVLWHTLGFHRVTSAEDCPVLPREHGAFELRPMNFVDRNPALDLRRAPFEVVGPWGPGGGRLEPRAVDPVPGRDYTRRRSGPG